MKRSLYVLILLIVIVACVVYYFVTAHKAEAPAVGTVGTSTMATDEHASQGDNRISAAKLALIGIWKSNDDAKYSRTFQSDGTVTDLYRGDTSADATGTWSVFTKESPDSSFSGTIADGFTYLKVVLGVDTYFYSIMGVTPESLELSYLDRGNTLSFTKVEPAHPNIIQSN